MADRYVPRKLVCVACGYAAGLLAAAAGIPLWAVIPVAVCGAAVAAAGIKMHRAYIMAAGIMLLCAGAGICVYPDTAGEAGDISFEAVVYEADCEGTPFYIVRSADGRRTGVYTDAERELVRGDRIMVTGTKVIPKNISFMRSRGVYSVMYSPDIRILSHSGGLFGAVSTLRQSVLSRIRALETGDSGEILIGMTFGSRFWRAGVSAQNILYRSGAGHAAAVSGLHITTAAAFLAGLFRKNIRRRFIAVMAAGAFICLAADFSAPVVRALVMLAAVYAAPLFGRRSDALTSLCAAALLILIPAPYCITSASFLLSAAGVVGSSVIAPAVIKQLRQKLYKDAAHDGGSFGTAADTVISVLCTQIAVMPVTFLFFDEIPVAAPLTNIFVLPLCTAAIFISYAAVLLSFLPALSSVLFVFAVMICRAVLSLCELFGSIGTPVPAGYIGAAAVIAVIFSLAGFAAGKRAGTAVTVSCLSLVMIYASVLRAVPDERTRTYSASGCAVIAFTDGGAAIDLGKHSFDVRSLAAENGVYPTAVFCTEGMADTYREIFPEAQIYDCGIYLDYRLNDAVLHLYEGGAEIDTGGEKITISN